ncbi:MAG: membrane dipeptidase [Myxococcales bacterium]|nr:membrane dipeptidase [Myxococcales bacterium]
MTALAYVDHRRDPALWARSLNISREAVELYLASDVIDLHLDTFIWQRMFRYDLAKRHGGGLFGHRFYSQVDLPRIREARVTGGIWVITTNPARRAASRARVFSENLERLTAILDGFPDDVTLVRTAAQYEAAVRAGRHAAFLGIQGGNALDAPGALDRLDDRIVRVTLVHLSRSSLGQTSSPLGGKEDTGLTAAGHAYVEALDAKRIFVDLAHISRKGFFEAAHAHDASLPLIVTHTGVTGVHPHWRNLDDEQLRVIADTGGTIGVMYESSFLGPSRWTGRAALVADHVMHIVNTVGADHASLGSDWDGAIWPPRDLVTPLELPRVVQLLLDRGLAPDAIRKVLGKNFLRTLRALRG